MSKSNRKPSFHEAVPNQLSYLQKRYVNPNLAHLEETEDLNSLKLIQSLAFKSSERNSIETETATRRRILTKSKSKVTDTEDYLKSRSKLK